MSLFPFLNSYILAQRKSNDKAFSLFVMEKQAKLRKIFL